MAKLCDLRTLGLVAAAAVAVGSTAEAQPGRSTFDLVLAATPTETDVQNLGVFLAVPEMGPGTLARGRTIGNAAAGETTSTVYSLTEEPVGLRYAFYGAYGDSGVTLGISEAAADAVMGMSWEELITDPQFSEAAVRQEILTTDAILALGPGEFGSYLDTLRVDVDGVPEPLFADVDEPVTLINFSVASFNGVGSLTTGVPEPSGLAVVASMLAIGSCGRRVRTAYTTQRT